MQDFKHYKQGLVNIDKIKPYERNAKIHNSLQLEQIKNSILEFGFTNPLIVDRDFNLIAGHGRLEALKMLNRVEFKDKPIKEVNAVIIDGLSETQKKALIIADNKITENAIWDEELLKSELVELENFSDILGDIDLKLDDDLRGLYQWRFKDGFAYNKHKLNEDEIYSLLEKYSILCDDFGFKFWGVNPITMPLAFRYFSPFSTVAYIGGPFQCILKGNDLRYDEKLHLKEDYDYILQNLNKYRGALRVNSIFYECDQNESRGGLCCG